MLRRRWDVVAFMPCRCHIFWTREVIGPCFMLPNKENRHCFLHFRRISKCTSKTSMQFSHWTKCCFFKAWLSLIIFLLQRIAGIHSRCPRGNSLWLSLWRSVLLHRPNELRQSGGNRLQLYVAQDFGCLNAILRKFLMHLWFISIWLVFLQFKRRKDFHVQLNAVLRWGPFCWFDHLLNWSNHSARHHCTHLDPLRMCALTSFTKRLPKQRKRRSCIFQSQDLFYHFSSKGSSCNLDSKLRLTGHVEETQFQISTWQFLMYMMWFCLDQIFCCQDTGDSYPVVTMCAACVPPYDPNTATQKHQRLASNQHFVTNFSVKIWSQVFAKDPAPQALDPPRTCLRNGDAAQHRYWRIRILETMKRVCLKASSLSRVKEKKYLKDMKRSKELHTWPTWPTWSVYRYSTRISLCREEHH